MEDDDEIHSHPASPVSGSPPRPNGRITVTVAAAPPAQGSNSGGGGSHNNSLALALVPIQQHAPPRNGGGGGGREDCWSEEATAVLIEAWGERYMELSRGNLKQKHWKEVADIVCGRDDYGKTPKTDIQCKNRIDTVKKKYKLERAKMAAGGGPSKWRFYDRLDHLIGPAAAKSTPPSAGIHHHKAVPMGIPVGIRPISQYHPPQGVMVQKLLNPNPNLAPNPNSNPNSKQKMQFRRRGPADSDSSRSLDNNSPDSTDSFPPESYKRPRIHPNLNLNSNSRPKSKPAARVGEDKDWGNSMKELSRAILKFGEVYEQAESSKLEQMVEIEKQRMKFAKEMELQRMQFFMKTQLEISQLKHHHESRIGMKKMKKNNHHSNIINNNNNSDSSN